MKLYGLSLSVIALMMLSSAITIGQMAAEKVVELTGKSRNKGYLGNVVVDDTKQQFDLVFVTAEKSRKIKFEVYQFDYNLNLVNSFADEQEVEKAKGKYKWFNFRGNDVDVVEGITAEPNLVGKLVLKRIQILYKYNWWSGKYQKEIKVLDKEKPTEAKEGKERKLFYTSHYNVDSKGEVIVCAMSNPGVMALMKDAKRDFYMLRYNSKLEKVGETTVSFDHPQGLVYSGAANDGDDLTDDDWILVFCPFGGQGYGKLEDPVTTNFTYLRVSPEGAVKERVNFQSKCNQWWMLDCFVTGNDVFLYGPGSIDKPEKNHNKFIHASDGKVAGQIGGARGSIEDQWELEKFANLQVIKISGGKAAWVSAPGIEEINSKAMKPPGQKKLYEFNGKKFNINGLNITAQGDIFINGQDFSMDNFGDSRGKVYKNFLMFHLDKDGNFKRFYGIDNTQKSPLFGGAGGATSFASESSLWESPDGKNLIWQIFFVKDIDKDCTSEYSYGVTYTTVTTTCTYTPLYQGRLGKIDIASGTVNDFKTFGGEDYYLYIDLQQDKGKDVPAISINGGKELIYIARERKGGISGSERWGKTLWLGRFDPGKM